jgi:replicative DNA helicase
MKKLDQLYSLPAPGLRDSQPAERALIGSILSQNSVIDSLIGFLSPMDFSSAENGGIYAGMVSMRERKIPIDLVTSGEYISGIVLPGMSLESYLLELSANQFDCGSAMAYAGIIRERSLRRQLIDLCADFSVKAARDDILLSDIAALVDRRSSEWMSKQGCGQQVYRHVSDVVSSMLDDIEKRIDNRDSMTGLITHFDEMDEMTGGLQAGELIIIAGRPSMGKTSFAMSIAENVSIKGGVPVMVFSLEMPSEQLVMRMTSSMSGMSYGVIRSGGISAEDFPKFIEATEAVAGGELYIDDSSGLGVAEIKSKCRRVIREKGPIGLVIIDYMQLMGSGQPAGKVGYASNRQQEISDISRGLKNMARELNVPVIALSQLNRDLEKRPNKRPMNSDLRDSGSIEQDADLIMFVYRDEVYNPDTLDQGIAEIIISKQRNGPIGTVRLRFDSSYTRFGNLVDVDSD